MLLEDTGRESGLGWPVSVQLLSGWHL